MPVHRGNDTKGCFYQYGDKKKYYYVCGDAKSRLKAKKLAIKQMVAIGYSKERSCTPKGSKKCSMKAQDYIKKMSKGTEKSGSKKSSKKRSVKKGSVKGSKKRSIKKGSKKTGSNK